MSSRERVLEKVKLALRDVPTSEQEEDVIVPRLYRTAGGDGDPVDLFARRVEEYRATVHRVHGNPIGVAVREVCRSAGVRALVVPVDLDERWIPEGVEVVRDSGLSAMQLDSVDGVLTGCALAIAETGTIVLDGGPESGRRAVTLIPDTHLCVVREDQIVAVVPEAIDQLRDRVRERRRQLTFVSGPSATSDIEFQRVEGVHGPRNLHVLLVGAE